MVAALKNPPGNENLRDVVSVLGLGRSPGGGHGNPLQYSCLGNSMERGAWWDTGCKESASTQQLNSSIGIAIE